MNSYKYYFCYVLVLIMKNKKNLIIIALVLLISLFGVTYAFFEYYDIGSNQKIAAGKVSLILNEGKDTINRSNIFPETIAKARAEGRTDNFITFTVSGVNTTEDQDIYYEIMLNEGDEETGMTRFNPEHLVFDLVELNTDGTEGTYLVDAMSYSDLKEKRIWVDTVARNTSSTVNKTYKLRMWLSENVLISDTDSRADYLATGYENHYASVKVSVYGDFVEKSTPYNYLMASPWGSGDIYNQRANIIEIHFVSMEQSEIDTRYEASTIKKDVTDTSKSNGGSVKAWLETDTTDTTKYIMYVASGGTTYFPTDCSKMFYYYSGVTSISFDNVNTKYATNMSYMFYDCTSVTNLDIGNWNTSAVLNMSYMFFDCTSVTNLDIGNWNTSAVLNMSDMFSGCSSLISLNASGWDTSNVNSMDYMFSRCEKLINLDISNFTFENATTYSYIFSTMSARVNNTPTIIVRSEVEQNWILGISYRPSSWTTDNVVTKDSI